MDTTWYESLEWFKRTPRIRTVLFVCTGNSCRSPTAEYYFKELTHWYDRVAAFSRGTEVEATIQRLKANGVEDPQLFVSPEVKKVIGHKNSEFLAKHKPQQITETDVEEADIVLAMERKHRDLLRKSFPAHAYKIFSLKGFVERSDDNDSTDIDVGNPFIPPAIKTDRNIVEGKIPYLRYMQNYAKILTLIGVYVRSLIEIMYVLNKDHKK